MSQTSGETAAAVASVTAIRGDRRHVLLRLALYLGMSLLAAVTLLGCTKAQQGTLIGAGSGAAIGAAAGGGEGAAIGAGIGAISGYMIGNEMDKAED